LLEGLEISILNLSDAKEIIDFRIDANTYKKDYLQTEKLIEIKGYKTIEQLSISVQNFGAYSLCNFINFQDDGIPFLMTENVRNNFINWDIQKYVDLESHNLLYKSHCKRGQVLVTMAGEYLGRVAVYDKDFVCSSNQAIAKITLKTNIFPYVISTFLNTKYGQNQINRLKTITGQPNINMSLIKSLKILSFGVEFSKVIEGLVTTSETKRDFSQQKYAEAENLLLVNLGLQDFEPSTEVINVKSFKESFSTTGRLDAEYYQPKYEDYRNIVVGNKHTFIKEEYIQVKEVVDRELEEYNYIEIGDINVGDGMSLPHKVLLEDLPANGKLKAKKGDLLISKVRPYRGAVSIIDNDYENLVVSGAFTVLRGNASSSYNNEVLKVLLRSNIYKDWLLQFNVGTSYPVIKDEDVLNLPIPFVEEIIQQQIATLVQESFVLKAQSENLLEVAKRAVEIAIEGNEDVALAFVNENSLA